MSFAHALSVFGREALRIVLPSWCVACGGELPWRQRTASCCGPCWAALRRIDGARCRSCALPLAGAGDALCIGCSRDPLPLDWCDAWGFYDGTLERVLHALKFERHDFLDEPIAALLEERVAAHEGNDFDAIVAVPMHRRKQRRRGYNQAALLADALARRTGVRSRPELLTKTAERRTQSLLARAERSANVQGLYAASDAAAGLSVLIVDDVCTTGETLRACSSALIDMGARRVCAVTVAKAT